MPYSNLAAHDPVLFVQHRPKKEAERGFRRQSFVAWVDGLGNCSGNDGGGHPDVVPSGGFAKSLALLRGCPEKREAAGWIWKGLKGRLPMASSEPDPPIEQLGGRNEDG